MRSPGALSVWSGGFADETPECNVSLLSIRVRIVRHGCEHGTDTIIRSIVRTRACSPVSFEYDGEYIRMTLCTCMLGVILSRSEGGIGVAARARIRLSKPCFESLYDTGHSAKAVVVWPSSPQCTPNKGWYVDRDRDGSRFCTGCGA